MGDSMSDPAETKPRMPGPEFVPSEFFEIPRRDERFDPYAVELIGVLWRVKWVVLLVSVGLAAAAAAASYLVAPRYTSVVLMMPQDSMQGADFGGLAQQFASLTTGLGLDSLSLESGLKAEALELLRSRSFLADFTVEHNLMPALFPEGTRIPVFWEAKPPTLEDAHRALVRGSILAEAILQVEEELFDGVVRLAVTWTDAELAAEWANLLFERINETMRERDRARAEVNIAALTAELSLHSVEQYRSRLYSLMEAEFFKILAANTSEQYVFRLIDRAHVTSRKSSPNRYLWLVCGGVFGFLASAGTALFRAYLAASNARMRNRALP